MDRPNPPTDWTRIRDRWLDFVQRVHAQWPEIELGVVQATLGHRDRLVGAVAETYGLDPWEAERAVAIWDASHPDDLSGRDLGRREPDDRDRSGPSANRSFA